MRARYRIDVTADDIIEGTPASKHRCAIALALRRQFGQMATVKDTFAIIPTPQGPLRLTLPQRAQQFISTFDQWGAAKAKPFRFILTAP